MPVQREHLQFAVIVLCVPLQLFISNYMGSTESNRYIHTLYIILQFASWLSKISLFQNVCYIQVGHTNNRDERELVPGGAVEEVVLEVHELETERHRRPVRRPHGRVSGRGGVQVQGQERVFWSESRTSGCSTSSYQV